VVGEHVRGEAGLRVRDVLAYGSSEVGFGRYCCVMPEGGDIFQ